MKKEIIPFNSNILKKIRHSFASLHQKRTFISKCIAIKDHPHACSLPNIAIMCASVFFQTRLHTGMNLSYYAILTGTVNFRSYSSDSVLMTHEKLHILHFRVTLNVVR